MQAGSVHGRGRHRHRLPSDLQGIAEIRHFFRTNETPIYFVGATPFNLLGIDRWVRNFRYVTYYDAWDGEHPHVITPRDKPYIEFSSGEEINNYLLLHPEMRARMGGGPARPRSRWSSSTRRPNGSATSSAMTWCCPGVAARAPRLEDRHHPARQRGGSAQRPERAGVRGFVGNPRPRVDRSRARHRPRRADAVRRLGKDDVLHLFGG